MSVSAIEVDRLTVRYGDVVAVRDLSFTAGAGQVTCVLGRNGAGKTSTIEALEGIRRATSGRLTVAGLDPQRQQRQLSRRIGVMLQDVGIQPAARVGELIRHGAALYPRSLDPVKLLERVGLDGLERRTFRQLSGGEQRRLALALALVGRPEVAFLDEPTAGVDPAGRQAIREIVGELRAQGVTVLLSTHDLDEAQRVADRVVVIHEGHLVAEGTIAELTARATATVADTRAVRFRGPAGLDTTALAAHLSGPHHEVPVQEESPGRYVVEADPKPWLIAEITVWLAERDIALADLETGQPTLEDVFLRLTGHPPDPDLAPTDREDDSGSHRRTPSRRTRTRASPRADNTDQPRATDTSRSPRPDDSDTNPPQASDANRPPRRERGLGAALRRRLAPRAAGQPPHRLVDRRDDIEGDAGQPPASGATRSRQRDEIDTDTDTAPIRRARTPAGDTVHHGGDHASGRRRPPWTGTRQP